jgi:hypothetical protein
LRRRYRANPPRELLADFKVELAGIVGPAQAHELLDAAVDVAGDLVVDSSELTVLVDRLHQVAFPRDPTAATAGHRRQAPDNLPEPGAAGGEGRDSRGWHWGISIIITITTTTICRAGK